SAPDPVGWGARVGADRGQFGTGEAGAVEDRLEPVALVAVRLFTETSDHTACLRVDRHLAAEDEMRPLARFAAQLRVRVGARDRLLIRAPTLRRPTRARLGPRQLARPRERRPLCPGRLLLARLPRAPCESSPH